MAPDFQRISHVSVSENDGCIAQHGCFNAEHDWLLVWNHGIL